MTVGSGEWTLPGTLAVPVGPGPFPAVVLVHDSGPNGRPSVTFKSYPRLNHLFIEGEGKSGPQEYGKPGHVAETVIADVAAWIQGQGPRPS